MYETLRYRLDALGQVDELTMVMRVTNEFQTFEMSRDYSLRAEINHSVHGVRYVFTGRAN